MDELSAVSFATALGPAALAYGPRGLVAVALPAQTEPATRRGLESVVARRRLGTKGDEVLTWLDAPRGAMAEAVELVRRALAGEAVELSALALDLRKLSTFAELVYREAQRIPRGEVRTYGELAAHLGSTARAVGQACGDNPLPLVVPCHRVVARSGMGGFSHHAQGWLPEVKRWLLLHESHMPPLFAR